MDFQKIRDAAAAIRDDMRADLGALVNRDRKALEAVALELQMEPNETNLSHIALALEAKGIVLMDAYPKMKYRVVAPAVEAVPASNSGPAVAAQPAKYEHHTVDSEAEENDLPTDAGEWLDAPPLGGVMVGPAGPWPVMPEPVPVAETVVE